MTDSGSVSLKAVTYDSLNFFLCPHNLFSKCYKGKDIVTVLFRGTDNHWNYTFHEGLVMGGRDSTLDPAYVHSGTLHDDQLYSDYSRNLHFANIGTCQLK